MTQYAEKIALIDYGAGNLHSVYNALKAAGAQSVEVTNDAHYVAAADRIILPGVGAFGACKDALFAIDGMIDALEQRVRGDAIPFLGICVGMQLLADQGVEYGVHEGLGWIKGSVTAFEPSDAIKIPHMGWNEISVSKLHPIANDGLLLSGEAYFLHGYKFDAADDADIIATTDHGGTVTAAVGKDNILGVQFHPEKSQHFGISFLSRFLQWRTHKETHPHIETLPHIETRS